MYKEAEEYVKSFRQESPHNIILQLSGVFDLFHPGHLDLITKAHKETLKHAASFTWYGGKLATIVSINSDESVRRIKGRNRPIYSQKWRKKILEGLHIVDRVFIFGEDTPANIVNVIKPDFYAKSAEWKEHVLPEINTLQNQVSVIYIEETIPIHTSLIINAIKRDLPLDSCC